MSGGLVTDFVVVGAVGAVAVLGAAGAYACAKATGQATRAVGQGLSTTAENLAERARRREAQAHRSIEQIRQAADQALLLNAQLAATRLRVARAGLTTTAPLPDAIVLDRQSATDLLAWVQTTRPALETVIRQLDVHDRQSRKGSVATDSVLTPLTRHESVRTAPANAHDTKHDSTHHATTVAAQATARQVLLAETKARRVAVLATLDPDAPPPWVTRVNEAALHLDEADTPVNAQAQLRNLEYRVRSANQAARRWRSEAPDAEAFLQTLRGRPDVQPTLLDDLERVVSGEDALSADLRSAAAEAAATVAAAVNRRHVVDTVNRVMERLGFSIDTELQTLHPKAGRLIVKPAGWNAHAVDLIIDSGNGQVRSQVIRTEDSADQDAGLVDVDRERQWCATVESLRTLLADEGITVVDREVIHPGEQRMRVLSPAPERAVALPPLARERQR